MRVTPDALNLAAEPGGVVGADLEVVNTTTLIDGVVASLLSPGPGQSLQGPAQLPLFPGAAGHLRIDLCLAADHPAGRHAVTVRVASTVVPGEQVDVVLDVDVAARTGLELDLEPRVRRARRRATFPVRCTNTGNVPVSVRVSGEDETRATRCTTPDAPLLLAPGEQGSTALRARGPRHRFGGDVDRAVVVSAEAVPTGSAGRPLTVTAPAVLRQRPLVARGVLTALILIGIVGLWAVAFSSAIDRSFGSDPLTKDAPASFYLGSPDPDGLVQSAAADPAGVLPKDGAIAPGVAGTVTGRVTATTTQRGVGRIVVQALRTARSGLVPATSAATAADGTFRLSGLFPGTYRLRFGATGFTTTADSAPLVVPPGGTVRLPAAVAVSGLPATISGRVDTGEDGTRLPVRVTATVLGSGGTRAAAPSRVTTSAADGSWTLTGLPAPNAYELRFEAPGYRSSILVEQVDGGQQRSEPTTRLDAEDGTIAGTVRDSAGKAVGGVAVTTTVDGQEITTATPTQGPVGTFLLSGLPTPGTYVVTFSLEGSGVQSRVVGLSPGETEGVDVVLTEGTGSVRGRVVDLDGRPLGGVGVTLGGAPEPVMTTTLTDGKVGSYSLAGLPTPGEYTLTFALAGYGSQTLPVSLDTGGRIEDVTATLAPSAGAIGGAVTSTTGPPVTGVTVTVTDGLEPRATTTVDSPAGTYQVAGLTPGTWTVTASAEGFEPQTALVRVGPGQRQRQDFALRPVGS